MKFPRNLIALSATAMLASAASAHPGHDHAAWNSPLIHMAVASAIVAALITLGWFLRRRQKNIRIHHSEQ